MTQSAQSSPSNGSGGNDFEIAAEVSGFDLSRAEVVDDPTDSRFELFLGLADQELRQRREAPGGDMEGVFIAEGDLVIGRALQARHQLISVIVEARRSRPLEFDPGDAPVMRMGEAVIEAIARSRRYRGSMAAFVRPKPLTALEAVADARTVLITERVNNPVNMGTILRTAAALGVDAVLADPTSCDPLARRCCRVSMGAVFAIKHGRTKPLPEGLEELKAAGFSIAALTPSPAASLVQDFVRTENDRVAFIVGAEGPGLKEETMQACDRRLRIEMHSGVDSLNVATAAAISLWHLTHKT